MKMLRLMMIFPIAHQVGCIKEVVINDTIIASYHHMETTGLPDQIMLKDGKKITIIFSENGNQDQLSLLRELPYYDIYGTFDGESVHSKPFSQKITLIGKLSDQIECTATGPNMASEECYQKFTLDEWTLELPFDVADLVNPRDPIQSPISVRRIGSIKDPYFEEFKKRAGRDLTNRVSTIPQSIKRLEK